MGKDARVGALAPAHGTATGAEQPLVNRGDDKAGLDDQLAAIGEALARGAQAQGPQAQQGVGIDRLEALPGQGAR